MEVTERVDFCEAAVGLVEEGVAADAAGSPGPGTSVGRVWADRMA